MYTPDQDSGQDSELQKFQGSESGQESAELQKFQGKWREVFSLRAGEDRSWSTSLLEVKGNKFETLHGKPVSGEIVINPQQQPPTINFNYDNNSGPYSGNKLEGIYRFGFESENVLIINLGLGAAENEFYPRPDKFESSPESSLVIFVRE